MTTTDLNRQPSTAMARIKALLGGEITQLRRNSTQLYYTVLTPPVMLLPILSFDWIPKERVGTFAILGVTLMALIFTVYYWATTVLVTRRESRVLLRFLTGETTKTDILIGIISPAFLITIAQVVLTGGVLAYLGVLPPMPAVHLTIVGLILAIVLFGALAVLTAAWTRTSESAQMTTMPVLFITLLGTGLVIPFSVMPDKITTVLSFTPLVAIPELISLGMQGTSMLGGDVTNVHAAALQPIAVLLVWTVVMVIAAVRYMRWHPRA